MHPASKKSILEDGLECAQYSDFVYSTPMYITFCMELLILRAVTSFYILQNCNFSVGVLQLPVVIILPEQGVTRGLFVYHS